MPTQPGVGYTFTTSSQGENFNIIQPWQPIPLVANAPAFVCSPYKVHSVTPKTGGGGDYVTFDICPGTFNNLMPQSYDSVNEEWVYIDDQYVDTEFVLNFASTTTSIVYLRVGPDSGSHAFPPASPGSGSDDPYPRIYSTGGALPTDSDTFGYVAIAKVTEVSATEYTVEQYVTGSLWGDRLKTGTDTARYYYARI